MTSAATVPSSRDPVISPAAELPAPAAATSIGITDSSRKKLVSEVNSARKVTASGRVRSRAGTTVSGCDWVKVLIARTLEPSGHAGKVRFHGDRVVRFESGATGPARPFGQPAAARPAGGEPARGDQGRPAPRRGTAPILPGARPRARRPPRHGAGLLRA